MTLGDGEPFEEYPIPEEAKNSVMHTALTTARDRVMFSHILPDRPVTMGDNMSLTIVMDDLDQNTV